MPAETVEEYTGKVKTVDWNTPTFTTTLHAVVVEQSTGKENKVY